MMQMRVTLERVANRDVLLREVLDIVDRHPGNDAFVVELDTRYGKRLLRASQTVDSWDRGLWNELETLLQTELQCDDEDCDL